MCVSLRIARYFAYAYKIKWAFDWARIDFDWLKDLTYFSATGAGLSCRLVSHLRPASIVAFFLFFCCRIGLLYSVKLSHLRLGREHMYIK